MRRFGAQANWTADGHIVVAPGTYTPQPFTVEADWSAASYWYSMAAFSDDLDLKLRGLFADSWQGDAVLATMMQSFGIATAFETDGIQRHDARPGAHHGHHDASVVREGDGCPHVAAHVHREALAAVRLEGVHASVVGPEVDGPVVPHHGARVDVVARAMTPPQLSGGRQGIEIVVLRADVDGAVGRDGGRGVDLALRLEAEARRARALGGPEPAP